MLGCREHVHVYTDFRNHDNGGKDVFEGRDSQDQVDFFRVGPGKRKDNGFQVGFAGFQVFIVRLNDFDFSGLFGRDNSFDRQLQLRKFRLQGAVN